MRHFERQFQVDGDVARNRYMDRWIGNDVATTLPLEVFTQRNFVADAEEASLAPPEHPVDIEFRKI